MAAPFRLAFLSMLLTGAGSGQQIAAVPGPGRIEGDVRDAMGRSVAGAEVWLMNSLLPHVRTDAQGWFAVSCVPVGQQWVRAKVRGWHRGCGRARVMLDNPVQFTHVIVLPAADLDVRVLDEQGKAIAGAEVMHSRTSEPGHYRPEDDERYPTDADGRLRLEDLALGQTAIHAWAPGYGLGSAICRVGEDLGVEIRLPKTDKLTLRLVLRGATPAQIGAARWMLDTARDGYGFGCSLPPSLKRGRLETDGTATIRGLPTDMDLEQIGIALQEACVTPRGVDLRAAATNGAPQELAFDVVLAHGRVTGVVLDPSGQRLPGYRLMCRTHQALSQREQELQTDSRGEFHIDSAGATGEVFRLYSRDRRFVFDQEKKEEIDEIRDRGIFLGNIVDSATVFEVHCVPASSLRGRIVDGEGHGVAGVEVVLTTHRTRRDERLDVDWATTDRDGLYAFAALNAHDEREYRVAVHGPDGDGRSAPFRLAIGQASQVDVKVAAPAIVTGVVSDQRGRPVAGASLILVLQPERYEMDSTISDRNGRYRLVCGAGTYELHYGCDYQRGGGMRFELTNGEQLQLPLVLKPH